VTEFAGVLPELGPWLDPEVGLDRRWRHWPWSPSCSSVAIAVSSTWGSPSALELLFLPAALLAHPHVSMVLHASFIRRSHASAAFLHPARLPTSALVIMLGWSSTNKRPFIDKWSARI